MRLLKRWDKSAESKRQSGKSWLSTLFDEFDTKMAKVCEPVHREAIDLRSVDSTLLGSLRYYWCQQHCASYKRPSRTQSKTPPKMSEPKNLECATCNTLRIFGGDLLCYSYRHWVPFFSSILCTREHFTVFNLFAYNA